MIFERTRGVTRPRLVVDLQAVLRNYAALQRRAAPARVMAVLKCNAYGAGIEALARTLWEAGCAEFMVARFDEGRRVRTVAPSGIVYVWQGLLDAPVGEYLENNFVPVLNSIAAVHEWKQHTPQAAALFIDTGLSRLGIPAHEFASAADLLAQIPVRMWFTHLAYLDELDHPFNHKQAALFRTLLGARPGERSIYGSIGAWVPGPDRLDVIRCASALLGMMPAPMSADVPSAVRLQATVLAVRRVGAGESIGYEEGGRVARDSVIATLGAGYGDGLPGSIAGDVEIAGERFPIIGDMSMDLMSVDVTSASRPLEAGSSATLFGGAIPLRTFASAAGWTPQEVLTRLHPDLVREYRS